MNHWGEWSWKSTRQVKRERSPEEISYAKRVTANKSKASTKESRLRLQAEARRIRALNNAPIDFRSKEERYWDELRKREREEARALGVRKPHDPEAGKRRAAAMAKATPDWADPIEMLRIYDEARRLSRKGLTIYHVDHVVPVQSKWVCGLNWEGNLEILPALENIKKGNRRWPDMPDSFLEIRAVALAQNSLTRYSRPRCYG